MKLLQFTSLLVLCAVFKRTSAQGFPGDLVHTPHNRLGSFLPQNACNEDETQNFQRALANFTTSLYKIAGENSNFHFVIAPYSIWLSLAALGEGGDQTSQKELFQILNLPAEACRRERYYQIAKGLAVPGTDVHLTTSRALVLDSTLTINPDWSKFVHTSKLLYIARAPIKNYNEEYEKLAKNITTELNDSELLGNSFIVDTLDYNGLWTTAFSDATIERETFYNDANTPIGTVDMMRVRRRARLAHIPIANAKVLELPVGHDGRYTMLIAMGLNTTSINQMMRLYRSSTVIDIFNALTVSLIPIDIAIPKFYATSEFNAKKLLENVGVKSLWSNPNATRYISTPPALPSGLLQRVTVKIDTAGLNPPPATPQPNILNGILAAASNVATGLATAVGRDFIANKPFMYALVDTKSETVIFEGAYSLPI